MSGANFTINLLRILLKKLSRRNYEQNYWRPKKNLKKTKTLGESDEEDDIVSWVSKNRKIEQEKREADKRAKMLEELDAQFGIGEVVQSEQRERMRQKYTEKDLKGLTVQHDVDTISEEHDVILTLKIKVY
nr:unnamed protein product [Callosobruchus chinensis]